MISIGYDRTMKADENVKKQENRSPNKGADVRTYLEHEHKSHHGKWLPGTSGNPTGRPQGSRQKIANALLEDIADVWSRHGKTVLTRLAIDDPAKLASIAYGLLPRDIFINVQQQAPANINPDDWTALVGLAKLMREIAPDAGLPEIEAALRSAFAKPVIEGSHD
jgi:Family of unknown function (DUF5681)